MTKPKFNLFKKENKIKFEIDSKLYDLDVIYGAAYSFIDRAYIYLDGNPTKKIEVYLKGKEKLKKEQLKNLAGEFLNELINVQLRYQISEKNKKIREYIASAALMGSSGELQNEMKDQRRKIEKEIEAKKEKKDLEDIPIPWKNNEQNKEDEPEWEKDPEDIAVPWEEKHGKKKDNEKLYQKNSEGVVVPWKNKKKKD